MRLIPLVCSPLALFYATPGLAQEPVIGGPCEGCEWVYVGIPANIPSVARIAPPGEPGESLTLVGTVYSMSGEPISGIIIYAYHTDSEGIYPEGTTRHGTLRGWAQTDARGRYLFDTIRPAAYPEGDEPQHIHLHVIEPGKGTYYVDDITFTDDPLLTVGEDSQVTRARGGPGRSTPTRDADGTWHVQRDIHLGMNIPGY